MEGMGSQGQRQRILIARRYKNPDFIFLDEATNALDANNEREIMEQLHAFYKRTDGGGRGASAKHGT